MLSTETAMKIISMLEKCAIWAAVFIVVFYITRKAGVSSNPTREAKKRFDAFLKYHEKCIRKMTDNKPDTPKVILKRFRKYRFILRDATKIFAAYAFEHPLRDDCQKAAGAFKDVVKETQKIFLEISSANYEKIIDHLNKITELAEVADNLLDEVMIKDNEEKILNV